MDLLSIILAVVLIVIVFNFLNKPSQNKNGSKQLNGLKPVKQQKHIKIDRSKKNPPSQTIAPELPVKSDSKPIKELGDFPVPPTTSTSSSLSPIMGTDLSCVNNGLPSSPDLVNELRTTDPSPESHFPKYYRKDYLSGNTLDTTELRFAGYELDESSVSWSDENVSQYPKYYKSDFEGGLTNAGAFFDQNNQYTDLTGPRTDASINDVCYKSKEGETVCLENDKLQNVPPSLISDISNCGFLNSIGLLEYSNRIKETNEKIMNGGILYDNVQGARNVNETPSPPLKPQSLSCVI